MNIIYSLTALVLSACTDIRSLNNKYADTCKQRGAASSVYCRDLKASIYIEVLKIKVQEIKNNKTTIISNQSIEEYQRLVIEAEDLISKIESRRPSLYQKIFKRWDAIPPIDISSNG